MAETTSEKAAKAISREIRAYLGGTIEPGFAVIRYPPGFHYNVQYGSTEIYYNPHTFHLIDRLCVAHGNGTASLTSASFSAKFASVLGAVGYHVSTADAAAAAKASNAFSKQEKQVIGEFESAFGRISQRMIKASGAIPATKAGYIVAYVQKTYPGSPPPIPFNLAAFGAAYTQWLSMGQQLEKVARQQQDALHLVAAATENSIGPSALNGGMKTGADAWSVAYSGLPDNNTIVASLTDASRTLTVTFELQRDGADTVSLRLNDQDLGSIPQTDLRLTLGHDGAAKGTTVDDLWSAAQKIEMSIVYTGITVLRADPVEISADLKTGWYSRQILTDIVNKTGKDITGLQLEGTRFSVGELFGKDKSFARVRTFVISQPPTVTMRFHGTHTGAAKLTTEISANQSAQLDLGEIVSFGGETTGFNVLDVEDTDDDVVSITLGPASPMDFTTVPPIDQTAHVIGGVVVFPP
ncbi:MAG: hypothetical protein JJ949_12180 [Roseicyclus sp.]|nr:hypothetical protein [Roseicyclus sp.]MBO6921739.1 hypothetical protein [Roseicyclus sp.]